MDVLSSLSTIENIIEYISENSIDNIINDVANISNIDVLSLINRPMGGYSKGRTNGAYYYVIRDLKENANNYKWVYEKLSDDKSKNTLLNLLRYRLTSNLAFINTVFDGENNQYFDKSIIKCTEAEVFVDCGAYIGDTVKSYIENYGTYKKIYSYEPSKENINECIENTKEYANVEVKNLGVGDINKVAYFSETGPSSAVTESYNENYINVVSIDEDIKEEITFLKMDIEGEEVNAINGAKKHIIKSTPKLAICVYHIVSDLWEIPILINSINPNYDFYLRQYEQYLPWETVLYAVPKD